MLLGCCPGRRQKSRRQWKVEWVQRTESWIGRARYLQADHCGNRILGREDGRDGGRRLTEGPVSFFRVVGAED